MRATSRPRVVSLFSGAGGLDVGFVGANFQVVWAGEMMPDACTSYRHNIGDHIHTVDISSVDPAEVPACDVLIGGPPCQGYSVAGHMNPEDPRSEMTWEFVRWVAALKPRIFVMENVKALAVLERWEAVRKQLVLAFDRLGYTTFVHLLDAQDFGVPQARERVFFAGTAAGLPPVSAIAGAAERATAGDVLRRLPEPGTSPNLGVCNAKVVPAKTPVLRQSPYAGMLFNGQGRPIDLNSPVNTLPASMGGNRTPIVDEEELRRGQPSWVVEYHARLMRGEAPLASAPERLRRITVTEAALFQTFPTDFRFFGSQNSQYTQIGNAVPPMLAEAVARAVMDSLNGRKSAQTEGTGQLLLFA